MPEGPPTAPFWFEKTNSCKPYGPPILHQDYPKLLPASGRFSKVKSFFNSFGLSSGNINTADNAPTEVVELYLKNTLDPDDPPVDPYRSQSFPHNATVYDTLELVDEYFRLPLTISDKGTPSSFPWLKNTKLVFTVKNNPSVTDSQLTDFQLTLTSSKPSQERFDLESPIVENAECNVDPDTGFRQYKADLSDILSKDKYALLGSWTGATNWHSPWKLQLSYFQDDRLVSCAWTYFHVPTQLEVRILEEIGNQKLIMLNGAANTLSNIGDTNALTDANRAELNPRAEELKNFNSVLSALELPAKQKTLDKTKATLGGEGHEHWPLVLEEWEKHMEDKRAQNASAEAYARAQNAVAEGHADNAASNRKEESEEVFQKRVKDEGHIGNANFDRWLARKREFATLDQDQRAVDELQAMEGYVPETTGEINDIMQHLTTRGVGGTKSFNSNQWSAFFQRKAMPRTYFGVMAWGGILVLRKNGTDWYPEKLFRCGTQTVVIESGPDRFNPVRGVDG